ncbi:MAG: nickel pincer cofactor biosynthesis protein LarB [Planctomycetes bacterium]|nr:nickel pincer cofactor biosynthesis protein LarB [Planctomycetota bacterium]
MNERDLLKLLRALRRGALTPDAALERLRRPPVSDLEFARLDHHRELRCGFPEVVLCQGKRKEDVARIAASLLEHADRLLLTRASPEVHEQVQEVFARAVYHERARAITCVRGRKLRGKGLVALVTAGTADIPVAEEARVTAEMMGAKVEARYDVGVAGIHRVLQAGDLLRRARVVVVAAGMEGALASVVGGMVSCPVIAVPTSVGYGASFAGLTALLGMLNSCAPNVSVVNIDNGFGAGYIAALVSARRR